MIKLLDSGPFSGIKFGKQELFLLILLAIIMIQSLGVIYMKQKKRLLHAELQSLHRLHDRLQIEWSQLLLEQGTWQSDARVEKLARDKLGMQTPNKINVIKP